MSDGKRHSGGRYPQPLPRCRVNGMDKMSFRSAAKARHAARTKAHTSKTGRLRPYQCPTCGFWHLTSA